MAAGNVIVAVVSSQLNFSRGFWRIAPISNLNQYCTTRQAFHHNLVNTTDFAAPVFLVK